MKSWLKFFGLSFFSDKIAKEARIRGVFNCVLGFVLALLFIFCGVLASNAVPFYTHYKNATDFKNFVHNFIDGAGLTISDNSLSSDAVVDTYLSETDAAKYSQNGYNLVIDTRPSTAFDDFEPYCVAKDGKEISYESYLALSDEEKGNYTFKIRYTADELVLTDEVVAKYEEYLANSADESIKNEYTALAGQKGSEDYKNQLYALYLKAYYAGVSAFDSGVPLLRSYYYINYINRAKTEKSLFIFDDMLFGYFNTDSGVAVTFYGTYNNAQDGALTDGDLFIKSVFKASVGVSAEVYLLNVFKFIPVIAGIPLLLALIAKLVFVAIKDVKYKKYTVCLKIECSYLAVAALITAIAQFICGFFVSSGILNSLPLIVFAVIMAGRTAALLIGEYIGVKRADAQKAAQEETTEG